MSLKELQTYNFISMQMLCCTEIHRVMEIIPILFPNHHIDRIDNPLRRINFKQKVKMGEVEERIHKCIHNIHKKLGRYEKYFINFIPFLNIKWMQQYQFVSPYLIDESTELLKRVDLLILQSREEIYGRIGDPSWYARPNSKTKSLENDISCDLAELVFSNDIRYITVNRLLKIAQEDKIRG